MTSMSPTKNPRFDELSRPDRYDHRIESERDSDFASHAACGLALLLPPGCKDIWNAAEIRRDIADHDRRMAEGMALLKLLDEQEQGKALS
jgi:hypothetical protein